MCERSLTLRALVNARLTAAAEEIFALVERTIAEYEEELCRSKEENQRNQQLLDSVLKTQLHATEGVQTDSSPESRVKQETPETPQIKEEPEEQSSENIIISDVFSLCDGNKKTEHSADKPFSCPVEGSNIKEHPKHWTHSETINNSLLQQHPTRKDFLSETEERSDNEEEPAAHNSGPFSKYKCGAESRATVTEGHGSGTGGGGAGGAGGRGGGGDKKHECSFCQRRFTSRGQLKRHNRVHTGERPFSCFFCMKTFSQRCNLIAHMRTHTGEKPFSCTVCMNTFAHKRSLKVHMTTHAGEKPFSCSS